MVGIGHCVRLVGHAFQMMFPVFPSVGMNSIEQQRVSNEEDPTLKIVAVGYGRTGTVRLIPPLSHAVANHHSHAFGRAQYSLALALKELGYLTLHTQHLYEHDDLLAMWTDTVFGPSIQAGRAILGTPDLHMIAEMGYHATADFPVALYYDRVLHDFPDCKFILTTRADGETWFRSWHVLVHSITPTAWVGQVFFPRVRHMTLYLRWLYAIVNQDDSYLWRSSIVDQAKGAAIRGYEQHNRRVRQVIPPHKLLEYNVQDGWEPLCQFLEVTKCPTTPFPRSNSAWYVQAQFGAAMIVAVSLVLFFVLSVTIKLRRSLLGTPARKGRPA